MPTAYINMNYKTFVLNRINDDYIVSSIATISCLFLIFGRLVGGYLFDRMKIINLLRYFLVSLVIGNVILYNIDDNEYSIIFAMMIIFFADGG